MKLINRSDAKATLDMQTGKIKMKGLFSPQDFFSIADQCEKMIKDSEQNASTSP